MDPGISVIIPTYNREKFVAEAIESVLQQEYEGKIELIISDDGSTDKTLEIAKSFGNKVIVYPKAADCHSQGVAANRNRGIKMASQPFIAFLDSDDFYLPGHLSKMVKVLQQDESLGFAFCRMLELKEQDHFYFFKPWTHRFIFKNDIRNPVVSRIRIVHTNSLLFRKIVFEKVGYFNENYSNGEDGDLWMRVSEIYRGAFSNHFGAIYRLDHGVSQLTRNSNEAINECFISIYENAIKRYYQLGLKDTQRIFELKLWLLTCKFHGKRKKFYLQLSRLISNYPSNYLKHIIVKLSEKLEKRETGKWQEINVFE